MKATILSAGASAAGVGVHDRDTAYCRGRFGGLPPIYIRWHPIHLKIRPARGLANPDMTEITTRTSGTIARTMTGQIATRIREKILAGDYAPGAPLLQDAIAAEFGVSKIPVREALVHLKFEGLVDIFAHRGFQVRPVSTAEADEVFSLRLSIEPEAVARGAKFANEEDHHAAKAALNALTNSLVAGDLSHSGNLNSSFHLALVVPRAQPVVSEVLYRLHTIAQRYVRMHLSPRGRVTRANREHVAIFEAWHEGKLLDLRRLIRTHITETRAELADALRPEAGCTRQL